MRRLIRSSVNALYLFAALCFTGMCADAATPLIDFPIGYSSNGGTYGFIGLIQQQHLLEQRAFARNLFISADHRLPKHLLPAMCR